MKQTTLNLKDLSIDKVVSSSQDKKLSLSPFLAVLTKSLGRKSHNQTGKCFDFFIHLQMKCKFQRFFTKIAMCVS